MFTINNNNNNTYWLSSPSKHPAADINKTGCPTEKAEVCCPNGWHIVFAGSSMRQYAPIEGEAATIAWALEKYRILIMGCPKIIEVTYHQPLTGIFCDRDFSEVHSQCLLRKRKSVAYISLASNIAQAGGTKMLIQFPAIQWP